MKSAALAAIGVMGMAFLAGCVTPVDLEANEPTISAKTSKDPKRYALCVFPKWQAARTDSSMVETEEGYRLWVASSSMADELLDVRSSQDGSTVELRQRMPWSPMMGRTAIEESVRGCL